MNRREILTAIFGATVAPTIEAADTNVIPKEDGNPLLLVVSFDKDTCHVGDENVKNIKNIFNDLVPGIPVAVLAPGMKLEAVYKTPPVKIHERLGTYEKTVWYDAEGVLREERA